MGNLWECGRVYVCDCMWIERMAARRESSRSIGASIVAGEHKTPVCVCVPSERKAPVCVCACVCVRVYAYVFVYMDACGCVCVCVCVCVCDE